MKKSDEDYHNEYEDYLKETEYCNYNNPIITEIAERFQKEYKSKRKLAVALFYWVKDNIKYSLGEWNVSASDTVNNKYGTCTNKANLLVALFRAVNIPAGFGIMKVNGQRYLGPACIPMLGSQMNQRSVHTYVAVHMSNRWMKIDPSDDIELSESVSHFNHTADPIDWNGRSNAELNLNKNDIYNDEFPIADIDYIMKKKPRNAKGIKLKIFNIGLNFYRNQGKNIKEGEPLEPILVRYLMTRHPFYFFLFITMIRYLQIRKTTSVFMNRMSEGINAKLTNYVFEEISIDLRL